MAGPRASEDHGRFHLRRFEWSAPDRLMVAGAFEGVAPPDAPALVLHGDDRLHRLEGTLEQDGHGDWTASFLWREPPVAFRQADLELDAGRLVTLPQPGDVDGGRALDIQGGAEARPRADASALGDALRLEAVLVATEEALRAEQAQRAQLEQELLRARADLDAERQRHAAAAERFREGLAHVQAVGEQALAVADAEIGELRERVGSFEADAATLEQLRGEHEQARREADELRAAVAHERERAEAALAQLEQTTAELDRARAEVDAAADLRGRLDAIRSALGDGT